MFEICSESEYLGVIEPPSQMVAKPSTRILVGAEKFNCVNSSLPALLANGPSPVVIMQYHTEKDITKFVSRMLWMHQKFHPSIGILRGVPDEETSENIEEACESLLNEKEDCIVILQ